MHWSFRDVMAVTDGFIMKGRCIIIPEVLKAWALDHLHIKHMGIEKIKLLACESIYWVNIHDDVENFIKIEVHVLHFSRYSQKTT